MTATNSNTAERAGSVIVAAVESAWEQIQRRHPQVPDVVVTFGAGTIGSAPGTVKFGHFAAQRWATDAEAIETPMHELFIGGEGLTRGAVPLLGTLLHEAAHALAHARGIQDTSRQGRYHNGRFQKVAEETGITVTKVGAIGWSETTVPDETTVEYAAEVALLGLAIRAYRRSEGGGMVGNPGGGDDGDEQGEDDEDEKEAKKRRNGVSAVCRCEKPRRIRVAWSVWEGGPITCGVRAGLPRPRHHRARQQGRRRVTARQPGDARAAPAIPPGSSRPTPQTSTAVKEEIS